MSESQQMQVESPTAEKRTRCRPRREDSLTSTQSKGRKRWPDWLELGCEAEYCEWNGEFRGSWCSGEVIEHVTRRS